MTKQEIRKTIKEMKTRMLPDVQSSEVSSIIQRVMSHPRVMGSKHIIAYWSLDDEFPTHDIVSALYEQGKNIYLPHVIDSSAMEIVQYQGVDTLREGAYGIMEPCGKPASMETLNTSDTVVLVPGVAFTPSGARLGRGKGYYDRFLSALTEAYKIGLCFQFQLLDSLPTSAHDISVDEVVC